MPNLIEGNREIRLLTLTAELVYPKGELLQCRRDSQLRRDEAC